MGALESALKWLFGFQLPSTRRLKAGSTNSLNLIYGMQSNTGVICM
jgi:hypothetical protein